MRIQHIPAYSGYTIPADVYKGVENVDTISVWNVLVVNANLDEQLAYDLTKTAFENIDEIRRVVKAANTTSISNASQLSGVPIHPGAQKYIAEHL